jgi:hypothetical protein
MIEYRLRTIKDIFDTVPADRLEDCMKELTTLMVTSKHTAELMRMVVSDVSGEEVPNLYAFPEEIVWRDDGEGILQANFPFGDEKLSLSIHRGKSAPKGEER